MWITPLKWKCSRYPSNQSGAGGIYNPLPYKGNTMTTQNDIPEPEDCLECKDARNCTTTTFQTKVLTDPLPQVDQSITDYLSSLCECGHQLIPSFVSGDTPPSIEHTKLCREHTVRWMQQVIEMKLKFNPEGYGTQLQP